VSPLLLCCFPSASLRHYILPDNEKAPIPGIAAHVEVRFNLKVFASNPSDVHGTIRQSRYWIPIAVRKSEKLAMCIRHLDPKHTQNSRKPANSFFIINEGLNVVYYSINLDLRAPEAMLNISAWHEL
jgi:hypothetical protein